MNRIIWLGVSVLMATTFSRRAGAGTGPLYTPAPQAHFHFEGVVGQRITAEVDNWLLTAPRTNPGMLEMFRVRDREPKPNLVPWAGEFVGKYLISAIQMLRMVDRPDLKELVEQVIADLISTQADDGYLGPFSRANRLKGDWDLWGHYHVMLALMMWYDATGDASALKACERAADLMTSTFLDGPLRVFDAGSQEMNMAVIHGLGRLYRMTRKPQYLQLMRAVETDWQRAGDYFRTGLSGLEFFETPRPRWESLHDLQGLLELAQAEGEPQYAQAFIHHWRSIARWDRRNTGGFSSGEQATGNSYGPTAIETCCTVAWMAVTTDMLQWTGQAPAGDELELSLFNAALGALHPTGRWCTYNTPMDGAREASAHTIVFQARAGTPELNCCSVNGPRGLGLLSEWAVLNGEGALMVNYYGPGNYHGRLSDDTPVALTWTGDYPLSDTAQLQIEPLGPRDFRLLLRIPRWSRETTVKVNGQPVPGAPAGQYLELNRRWEPGDLVTLGFDFRLRSTPGDREALGRSSVYRGPLLLAYDQALNAFDENAIPPLDPTRTNGATPTSVRLSAGKGLEPWLTMDLPAENGTQIRVCDFASAGARGTRYRSWFAVAKPLPPAVVSRVPRDGASLPLGETLFRWTGPKHPGDAVADYQLLIGTGSEESRPVIALSGITNNWAALTADQLRPLPFGRACWWRIVARNHFGSTTSVDPCAQFTIVPTLPDASSVRPGSIKPDRDEFPD